MRSFRGEDIGITPPEYPAITTADQYYDTRIREIAGTIRESDSTLWLARSAGRLAANHPREPDDHSSPEATECAGQVWESYSAIEKLVERNLTLATWFVRKSMALDTEGLEYEGSTVVDWAALNSLPLDYSERMQLAGIGLWVAILFYNPRRMGSLAPYAFEYMESSLLSTTETERGYINKPRRVDAGLLELSMMLDGLERDGIYNPTFDQVAELLSSLPETAYKSVEDLDRIRKAQETVSLDQVTEIITSRVDGDGAQADDPEYDERLTPADLLPDPTTTGHTLEETVIIQLLGDIDGLVSTLEPKEQQVLMLLYRDTMTLRDTGIELGLSSKAVAKIEERALEKLRRLFTPSGLSDYIKGGDDHSTYGLPTVLTLTHGEEAQLGLDGPEIICKPKGTAPSTADSPPVKATPPPATTTTPDVVIKPQQPRTILEEPRSLLNRFLDKLRKR